MENNPNKSDQPNLEDLISLKEVASLSGLSHELHPPFSCLSTLIDQNIRENEEGSGSEFVTLGALFF